MHRRKILPHRPLSWSLVLLCGLAAGAPGCSGKDPEVACLAAGTRVATPGGAVRIESLRLGDRVLSVDPRTGARVPAPVVFIRSALRPCLRLTTADGRSVRTTAEHPFLSPETGRYEPAARWADGTLSTVYRSTPDGGLAPVAVVGCAPVPGRLRVFDVGVDSAHHNFLGEGLVVHNKTIAPELLVAGTWNGEYVDRTTGITHDMVVSLTRTAPGEVAGTLRLAAPSCVGEGAVRATSYGGLQGTITFSDAVFSFRVGKIDDDELQGVYRLESGAAPCLGSAGPLELRRVSRPAAATDADGTGMFRALRIDERGVEDLGPVLLGR